MPSLRKGVAQLEPDRSDKIIHSTNGHPATLLVVKQDPEDSGTRHSGEPRKTLARRKPNLSTGRAFNHDETEGTEPGK